MPVLGYAPALKEGAELCDPETGRLDAVRMADEMRIPATTLAKAIGRKAPGVRKHPDSPSLQAGLRSVYRIWSGIVEQYAGDRSYARMFLNTPNRNLGGKAPIEFFESGELSVLESLVAAMETRQPA